MILVDTNIFIDIPDTLIAATALVFNIELRTYNLKDFQFIPTLQVSSSLEVQ